MTKEKVKDIGYALTKAGISMIPIAGAAASELLPLIVTPPMERRRENWMSEVGERLLELEKESGIDLEKLQENEIFIDVVLHSTQLALRTSQQEKLEMFKNAITNTAAGLAPEQAEIQIMLNLIDSYTVWHVKILKLFDDPNDWFSQHDEEMPKNLIVAGLKTVLETAYPELKGRTDFYNLIWEDLNRAGLLNSGSLQASVSGHSLTSRKTTDFGRRFLEFIGAEETTGQKTSS